MQIAVRDAAGLTSIVAFTGELDVYTAPRAKEALLAQLERGRCFIVVNLERLTYVDTAGLGVLIEMLQRARSNGGALFVVTNGTPIWRLFTELGLVKALALCEDEQSAITAANAAQALVA